MGALVGTVGLWAAVAVRIPVQNLWMRVLIACSLIIGVLTMLPYSLSIVYGSIVDAAQPHGFQNLGWGLAFVLVLGGSARRGMPF